MVFVCIGLLVFLVPLVPFHFIDISSPSVTLRLFHFFPFFMAFLIIGFGLWNSLHKETLELQYPYWIWLPTSLIALFFSLFSNFSFTFSFSKMIYYVVTGELLCLAVFLVIRKRKTIYQLVLLVMATAALVSLYGILEVVVGIHWLRDWVFRADNPLMIRFSDIETKRALSTIGNPNPLGSYLSLCSPFFLFVMFNGIKRSSKILAFTGWILLGMLVFFTFSRGAWIAFGVGLVIYTWMNHHKRLAYLASLFGVAVFFVSIYTGKLRDPYTEFNLNYHRINSYEYATLVWEKNPLFGAGLGNYRNMALPMGSQNDTPDNMYLLMLAETGIVGLIARVGLFVTLFYMLRSSSCRNNKKTCREEGRLLTIKKSDNKDFYIYNVNEKTHNLSHAFFASFAGFVINIMTWDALYFPVIRIMFWILVGLAFAYVFLEDQCKSN